MNNNNQEYSCVIVDDEEGAIELLSSRVRLFFKQLQIAATFTRWEVTFAYLQTQDPDLIFMDISMPGTNGIKLMKMLPDVKSEIIFTTAHAEYAVSAFELSTSGYLLKPIDDTELIAAINKSLRNIQTKRVARQTQGNNSVDVEPKIGIPNYKGIEYVSTKDIVYFEAVKRYVKVMTTEKEILSSHNIGKFRLLAESSHFYQVHRSYIVNLNHIERYEHSGIIVMRGGHEIPVAKNGREAFLSIYGRVK